MHYLSVRFAVLAAAMTFSLAPLGQAATASGDKPVAWSMSDRNSILPPSANSPNVINSSLVRYTATIVEINMEWQPTLCIENSPGAWTVTADPKYGKVTTGKEHIEAPRGECPGKIFTFATISYEWTAHNNKTVSTTINDTFNATWSTSDGYNIPFTFNIKVPVVRPASETTAFVDWNVIHGRWRQTLHPPADDPSFDFSGETVQEFAAKPDDGDACWFPRSARTKFVSITGGTWTVMARNVWEFDSIGWATDDVIYYRLPHFGNHPRAPCGTKFGQQMKIQAPPDAGFNNYATINVLEADIGTVTVTSVRAGNRSPPKTWP